MHRPAAHCGTCKVSGIAAHLHSRVPAENARHTCAVPWEARTVPACETPAPSRLQKSSHRDALAQSRADPSPPRAQNATFSAESPAANALDALHAATTLAQVRALATLCYAELGGQPQNQSIIPCALHSTTPLPSDSPWAATPAAWKCVLIERSLSAA